LIIASLGWVEADDIAYQLNKLIMSSTEVGWVEGDDIAYQQVNSVIN